MGQNLWEKQGTMSVPKTIGKITGENLEIKLNALRRSTAVCGSTCSGKFAGNVRGENWKYGRITECYDRIG